MRVLFLLGSLLFLANAQLATYYYATPDGQNFWATALNKEQTTCSKIGDTGPSCFIGKIDPSKSCTGNCKLNCGALACVCCNGVYQCGACVAKQIVPRSVILAGDIAFDSSLSTLQFPGKKNTALFPSLHFIPAGGSVQCAAQANWYRVVNTAGILTAGLCNNDNILQTVVLTDLIGPQGAAAKSELTRTPLNVIIVASNKIRCPPAPTNCTGSPVVRCNASDPPVGKNKLCCLHYVGNGLCEYDHIDGVTTNSSSIVTTGTGLSQTRTLHVSAYHKADFGNLF